MNKLSRKIQIKRKIIKATPKIQDSVIFMTAYKCNKYNKRLALFKKKEKVKDLLSSFHISAIANRGTMLTQKGKLKYTAHFDAIKQSTRFDFDVFDENDNLDNYEDDINRMLGPMTLIHSMELLLDKTMFELSFIMEMESFIVSVNSRLLQVEPIAFLFNGMYFVNFELYDLDTGIELNKDDIYSRRNNYNMIP